MTNASPPLILNTRFLAQNLTGVQRYGREMLARFTGRLETVRPKGMSAALPGHAWEQFILPRHCRGRLLWSPGNTGPLSVARQVVTLHDASTLDHPEWFSRTFALWYRFLLPRLARRVKKVITVSEFSRQRLMETCGISADRMVIVPNGIDARFHPSTEEEVRLFRDKNRLARPYLVYLGSLEPRKNVVTLLKAWRRLAWKEGELVLAGAPGHVFRDRGFAELPPGIRLWGRVSDEELPTLLSGATGLVFPSLYEGFGFPALEAMACGCPVAVSATTSLPEVCGPAFDPATATGNALYFDPVDLEEMAQAMQRLIDLNPAAREHLRRNGVARAAEFTWERSADLTWTVLQGAMNDV
jgi:glycosyltransferase involved in cell wall biosynthesis